MQLKKIIENTAIIVVFIFGTTVNAIANPVALQKRVRTTELKKQSVGILFVLSAKTGIIKKTKSGYILTLSKANPKTLWFTDRPNRKAGFMKTTKFTIF